MPKTKREKKPPKKAKPEGSVKNRAKKAEQHQKFLDSLFPKQGLDGPTVAEEYARKQSFSTQIVELGGRYFLRRI